LKKVCYFCGDKPRKKPFWIQLGTNGPFVCGGQHYHDPKTLTEIDRIIDAHMGKKNG